MTDAPHDPLFGPPADEVPLSRAPLVKVLCQVRFTRVLKIHDPDFIAEFHERLRRQYPILDDEHLTNITVGPTGPETSHLKRWKLSDANNAWRVYLASDFVTVETDKYLSRADFVERLRAVLVALDETVEPSFVTRIGVRYVDRIEAPELEQITALVRDELIGATTGALRGGLQSSMSAIGCNVKEGDATIRWGWAPKETSHDPNIMPPVGGQSWMLDIDVYKSFAQAEGQFDGNQLSDKARDLAIRAYSIFRWAVTQRFLETYGGTP